MNFIAFAVMCRLLQYRLEDEAGIHVEHKRILY